MSIRVAAIAYTHYESDPRVRREAEILAKRGDDVTVWCLRQEGQAAEGYLNGVRLLRVDIPRYRGSSATSYVSSYGRFLGEVTLAVYRQHRRRKFDLVHVHTMPDFLVVAGLLPKLSGAKVVLDMHDLMPDLYALKFGLDRDGRVVSVLRGLERLSVAMSDHAVCVHEPQYRLLLRDGVPSKKLSVVMNAPDPEIFAARTKQPSIKSPDGEIRMIYHGTILHRFGVDVAVRALAEARRQNPRLRLQIIGDGDFLPDVRRLAAELELDPPALEIIGQRLPIDEVARLVRDAHIGIVPNRDDQEDSVLPNKLLEYVSIGIPVIATRTRCITHYFGERELELVPIESVTSMASAMVRLSKDRERRRELILAAKAWEDRFGYQRQRRAFLDVVDVVTTGRRIEEPVSRAGELAKQLQAPMSFEEEDDAAISGGSSSAAATSGASTSAEPSKSDETSNVEVQEPKPNEIPPADEKEAVATPSGIELDAFETRTLAETPVLTEPPARAEEARVANAYAADSIDVPLSAPLPNSAEGPTPSSEPSSNPAESQAELPFAIHPHDLAPPEAEPVAQAKESGPKSPTAKPTRKTKSDAKTPPKPRARAPRRESKPGTKPQTEPKRTAEERTKPEPKKKVKAKPKEPADTPKKKRSTRSSP
ncbi:MAG: glycosyltransferase [Deltaproteobacteria bacterium]|nr:glycosyltransferase [Deltaproteobacteria bacterium]